MKITRDLILNCLAFAFGSVIAEYLIQREERKRTEPAPAP